MNENIYIICRKELSTRGNIIYTPVVYFDKEINPYIYECNELGALKIQNQNLIHKLQGEYLGMTILEIDFPTYICLLQDLKEATNSLKQANLQQYNEQNKVRKLLGKKELYINQKALNYEIYKQLNSNNNFNLGFKQDFTYGTVEGINIAEEQGQSLFFNSDYEQKIDFGYLLNN